MFQEEYAENQELGKKYIGSFFCFFLFVTDFIFIEICITYLYVSFKSCFKTPSLKGHRCKAGKDKAVAGIVIKTT